MFIFQNTFIRVLKKEYGKTIWKGQDITVAVDNKALFIHLLIYVYIMRFKPSFERANIYFLPAKVKSEHIDVEKVGV